MEKARPADRWLAERQPPVALEVTAVAGDVTHARVWRLLRLRASASVTVHHASMKMCKAVTANVYQRRAVVKVGIHAVLIEQII